VEREEEKKDKVVKKNCFAIFLYDFVLFLTHPFSLSFSLNNRENERELKSEAFSYVSSLKIGMFFHKLY